MKHVGIYDARAHFSALISDVIDGQTLIVTRKGVPVAKIIPIGAFSSPRIIA